jgi:hypothetical protein
VKELVGAAVLALLLTAGPMVAQKPPKLDSLLVMLALPRDSAIDATVAAFTAAGLPVTDQGSGFVTADLGEGTAMGYGTNQMLVRASIFTRDGQTTVVLRGEAKGLSPATGSMRITNRQKGPYQNVWRQMEAVAAALAGPPSP